MTLGFCAGLDQSMPDNEAFTDQQDVIFSQTMDGDNISSKLQNGLGGQFNWRFVSAKTPKMAYMLEDKVGCVQ